MHSLRNPPEFPQNSGNGPLILPERGSSFLRNLKKARQTAKEPSEIGSFSAGTSFARLMLQYNIGGRKGECPQQWRM